MRDDQTLVHDLQQGDATALGDVYQRYKDDLLTVALCLLGDRAAAEDCLHDTIVAFAAGIHRFRLRGNLKGFLATSVANRARDRLRREKRLTALAVGEYDVATAADCDPSELAMACEQYERLRAALARLPYEQRESVTLHLHGRLTFREVGRHQSVSTNTAHRRYRYAIDKLRVLLHSEQSLFSPALRNDERNEK